MLDARYEKVRHGGQLLDCAVLIALGVDPKGKRSILGAARTAVFPAVPWQRCQFHLQQNAQA